MEKKISNSPNAQRDRFALGAQQFTPAEKRTVDPIRKKLEDSYQESLKSLSYPEFDTRLKLRPPTMDGSTSKLTDSARIHLTTEMSFAGDNQDENQAEDSNEAIEEEQDPPEILVLEDQDCQRNENFDRSLKAATLPAPLKFKQDGCSIERTATYSEEVEPDCDYRE